MTRHGAGVVTRSMFPVRPPHARNQRMRLEDAADDRLAVLRTEISSPCYHHVDEIEGIFDDALHHSIIGYRRRRCYVACTSSAAASASVSCDTGASLWQVCSSGGSRRCGVGAQHHHSLEQNVHDFCQTVSEVKGSWCAAAAAVGVRRCCVLRCFLYIIHTPLARSLLSSGSHCDTSPSASKCGKRCGETLMRGSGGGGRHALECARHARYSDCARLYLMLVRVARQVR
mmetsp:Transcript_84302/g.136647  ORF Transcript_84302/g.136647 Transcript_84302/m.136647 type:complete len:229 (-) Transcript_84302:419-1105(-)